jgi:hypothetical protein
LWLDLLTRRNRLNSLLPPSTALLDVSLVSR